MKRLASTFNAVIAALVLVICAPSAGAVAPAVGAGNGISAVLKVDGSVWTWGKNDFGQLGNDSRDLQSYYPVLASITGVSAIAVGDSHLLAVKSDKTVAAWGKNESGQLGNGQTAKSHIPITVPGLTNIIAVAAGVYTSAALSSDGKVWTWGKNNYGQLGNGTFVNSRIPVQVTQVTGFTNITAIAVGTDHMLALKNDGTVWAWGANSFGQLGNGTYSLSNVPVQVKLLIVQDTAGNPVLDVGDKPIYPGVKAISSGSNYSLAVMKEAKKKDGTVIQAEGSIRGWGDTANGQLGNGNGALDSLCVEKVANRVYGYFNPVTTVASVVISAPPPEKTLPPVPTPTSTATSTVTTVSCTPTDEPTEIIRTVTTTTTSPTGTSTQVVTTTTSTLPLTGAVAVSGGKGHTVARLADGSVMAWGANGGLLGNGTPEKGKSELTDTNAPMAVTDFPVDNASIAIAASSDHTLALGKDNTVWAWGTNTSGQLGNGSVLDYPFPIQITAFDGSSFVVSPTPASTTTTAPQAKCESSNDSDADVIFNWAETKYGENAKEASDRLFYPQAASESSNGYIYRHYTGTDSYLAYKSEAIKQYDRPTNSYIDFNVGNIFYYAPQKLDQIISLGRACIFLNMANEKK